MSNRRRKLGIMKAVGSLLGSVAVFLAYMPAALANGIPVPWGLNLQAPASVVEKHIHDFHDILLVIITLISLFVLGLLIYVIVRYNAWANPRPSRTAHNIPLEIVWTLVPCFILLGISFLSFPLLYFSDRMPASPDLTLKVIGHQWYWTYEFPDHNGLSIDSHAIWDSSAVTADQANKLIADAEKGWLIKEKPLRLLEVDNRLVLPVGKNIRVEIAGTDVEHSWFVPAFGVNRMAIPGRLSELPLKIDHEGLYYGQCSMICGQGHGYMPIVVEAVSPEKFEEWVESKKKAVGQNNFDYNRQYASFLK